jgi:Holliday junction resolvase RusA-like endonuclease
VSDSLFDPEPLRQEIDDEPEVMWGTLREFDLAGGVVLEMRHDGDPKSKARARVTKTGHSYTPKETVEAEARLEAAARFAMPRGWQVDSEYHWGILAVFFQATAQRRDVDNMLKLVSDALTGVVWKDDSQVSEISARLRRSDPFPRTHIRVYRCFRMVALERACERCGTKFPVHPGTIKRFCTHACASAAKRIHPLRKCETCGRQYKADPKSNSRACSRECRRRIDRAFVECPECGEEFDRPRSLMRVRSCCSPECLAKYRVGLPRSNADLLVVRDLSHEPGTQAALDLTTEGTTAP